jgi:hypothetical protein
LESYYYPFWDFSNDSKKEEEEWKENYLLVAPTLLKPVTPLLVATTLARLQGSAPTLLRPK